MAHAVAQHGLDSKTVQRRTSLAAAAAFGSAKLKSHRLVDQKNHYIRTHMARLLDTALARVDESMAAEAAVPALELAAAKVARRSEDADGLKQTILGIVREFLISGDLYDLQWLDYLLTQRATGRMRVDRSGVLMPTEARAGEKTSHTPGSDGRVVDASRAGETLVDFHQKADSRRAQLNICHVLVCRIYTCRIDRVIQKGLRRRQMEKEHPLRLTVEVLSDALKLLRVNSTVDTGGWKRAQEAYSTKAVRERARQRLHASPLQRCCADLGRQWHRCLAGASAMVGAEYRRTGAVVGDDAPAAQDGRTLWRGVNGVRLPAAFLSTGGAEPGAMSCSRDLKMALRYALKGMGPERQVQLFMFEIHDVTNPLLCGAPLQYLSCYPEEAEETFPPLTLMKPVKRTGAAGVGACVDAIVGATPNDGRHTTIVVGDLTFTIVSMYLSIA